MREPFPWAYPIFRMFGIPVKIHITLIIFCLGTFLRMLISPYGGDKTFEAFLLIFPIFLLLLIAHELGHVFATRLVDGEATEIVLWPLGGLAFPQIPKSPRAQIITAFGGPMVNVMVCLCCFVILAGAGFFPSLNPFQDPFTAEMKNYRDQRVYTSEFGIKLYEPGTIQEAMLPEESKPKTVITPEVMEAVQKSGKDRAVAPLAFVWVHRIFWLSWVVLLLTMLPAYPLDGGQILLGFIWRRTDEDQAITTACWAGYVVAAILLIASLMSNEVWPLALAVFIGITCWVKINRYLFAELAGNEYDTGYNLNDYDDSEPAKPKKKQGFIKRWLSARNARRMQRDMEAQLKEDERLDQLLEKIARKEKLSAEEEAFMKRVSTRYKNR